MSDPKHSLLLDDDDLVRASWTLAARLASRGFTACATSAEFEEKLAALMRSGSQPEQLALYVDARLANGESGVPLLLALAQRGFTRLFLATGYAAQDFPALEGVAEIVGKDPPWGSQAN